jgi:hypothetical protein
MAAVMADDHPGFGLLAGRQLTESGLTVVESPVTGTRQSSTEEGGRALRMRARDGELIAAVICEALLVDQQGLVSTVAAVAGLVNPKLTLRLAKVTVGANSDNGEQPALRNS